MKIMIDLGPAIIIAKFMVLNIIAPCLILFISLIVGTKITDMKKVDEWRSRKRISISNNFLSSCFSLSNFQLIVSSILFVLLYNLLAFIK